MRVRDLMIWNTEVYFHLSVFRSKHRRGRWGEKALFPPFFFPPFKHLPQATKNMKTDFTFLKANFLIKQHNCWISRRISVATCVSVRGLRQKHNGVLHGECRHMPSGLNQHGQKGRDKRHSWAAQKRGMRRASLIAVLVVLMC